MLDVDFIKNLQAKKKISQQTLLTSVGAEVHCPHAPHQWHHTAQGDLQRGREPMWHRQGCRLSNFPTSCNFLLAFLSLFSIMGINMRLRIRQTQIKIPALHFLTVWCWLSHFTSLCTSVFSPMNSTHHGADLRTERRNAYKVFRMLPGAR